MLNQKHVTVIIPALNEEQSIAKVIGEIPNCVDQILVVDNDSQDATAELAEQAGARVVRESSKGYGMACLTGIRESGKTDILAFVDGGYSDYPEQLEDLIESVANNRCDLAIGCRQEDSSKPRGRFRHQKWGTKLVCLMIQLLHGFRFEDLGPMRCIKANTLIESKHGRSGLRLDRRDAAQGSEGGFHNSANSSRLSQKTGYIQNFRDIERLTHGRL